MGEGPGLRIAQETFAAAADRQGLDVVRAKVVQEQNGIRTGHLDHAMILKIENDRSMQGGIVITCGDSHHTITPSPTNHRSITSRFFRQRASAKPQARESTSGSCT